jgi:hypothetical protein
VSELVQQLEVRIPDKMVAVPTESMTLGDVLSINHPAGPTHALFAVLDADATLQNKTFAIVRQTPALTVVVCVRTASTIWPYALEATEHKNLIGDYRGKRFKGLERGNRLQVVNFSGHPYIQYKPLNLNGLRVYASNVSRQCGYKFVVSKTSYGAEVLRVA